MHNSEFAAPNEGLTPIAPEASVTDTRQSSQPQHIDRGKAGAVLTRAYLLQQYIEYRRTPAEIGASLGLSQHTVIAYLHKHGVTRREYLANLLTETFLRQAYEERGRTATAIGAETGVSSETVLSYLRRYDIPIRPKGYHLWRYKGIDSRGFADVSTDWHAYWIGFLAADGYIRANDREQAVHLRLKASDADHLTSLKEGLQADAPVQYLTNGGYPAAQIILRDQALVDALARWGVGPHKTMTLSWPDNLGNTLVPAYIRGYFDGDGTIYQRQRSSATSTWNETVCRFISGSLSFLERLADELTQRGIQVRKLYRNQNSNTYVLPLSSIRSNLLAFAALMYEGSTIALARKRAIFELLSEESGKVLP